jgi:tetrathionate reductase subunit B
MKTDRSSDAKPAHNGRRAWLGAAAAGLAGVMLAPGVRLIEVATAATPAGAKGANPAVRWGLLIDTTKCAEGCTDCVTACHTENGLGTPQRSTDARWIRKIEIKEVKTGRQASVPVMCQHCAEPPCVDVCPTGASFKRADGIVLVDRHSCIGCRYCMMACPYKARSFVHEPLADQKADVPRGKGCVESCTLCVHRHRPRRQDHRLRRGLHPGRPRRHRLRRPQRPGQRDRAPRARDPQHATARRPGSIRASATRGSEP